MKLGVMLPIGDQRETKRPLSYKQIRDLARTTEGSGLDSVWLADHLIYRFPERGQSGLWEAWTLLTALAEATEKVELGTMVLCTAFRNPAVLAKMAVTFDEISEGRLILGLGAGWHEPEFAAFDFPFNHLVSRFEEALKIIVPLVREGKVDFTGEYFSAPNCEMAPPPSRKIPVLIAGAKPRMLRLTAEYADSWNTAWLGDVSASTPRIENIHAACAEVNRDPASLEVTVGLNIAFPELGEIPEASSDSQRFITGSVEEVGSSLRAYREAGVGHLISNVFPVGAAAVELYGKAAEIARQ
jgi:alkanesulfonate monooxygenase SsuD/methylene tetrahydromethanopterin reductase-like flavin-dependent oxidoreductase (luciferase family)